MKTSYYYESTHDKNDTVEFHIGLSGTTLPHFHRSFEMLYVCRGKAHFTVNGQSFEAGSDEIAFVHKCCVHELVPDVDFTDFVLIIGPRFSEDFSKIFQGQTLQPHLADRQFNRTVRPYFETLHTLAGRKSPAEQLVKKGLVNAIVGSLVAHYPAVPVSTTPNIGIIVQTLNYIDDHFAEPITLDSISSEFGYNKYYFSRLFNSYIGDTLHSYINMVRVRKVVSAARKDSAANLSSLVFENGFDSMTTFYRNFSKYYDRPPKEVFRRQ